MNIERCTGIDGIYVNDELVYIGKTLNSFAKRFDNHNYYMRHSDKGSKMYKDLSLLKAAGNHIYMKPLVILEELKINRPLTDSELKAIELSFIYAFRPKYNEEGLTRKYNLDASQL